MRDCEGGVILMLKSTALPPGRTLGYACEISPLAESGIVTVCGTPPAADTIERPERPVDPKMIVLSSPQLAPQKLGRSQRTIGVPPDTGSFFSFRSLA